jgi:hypothetical protein
VASQIAHVIYTKKYLEKYPRADADLFILGTLFVDIRRIAKEINRSATHHAFPKIDLDFSGLSGFQAGWKFHLWCDMKREEILNKYNFYSLKHTTELGHLPVKLLEDEILYEKYDNWEKLGYILNNPPVIKLDLPIEQKTIERWYAIIAKYFEKKPDDKTVKAFLFKQSSLRKKSADIIDVVRKLRNNRMATEILSGVPGEILG